MLLIFNFKFNQSAQSINLLSSVKEDFITSIRQSMIDVDEAVFWGVWEVSPIVVLVIHLARIPRRVSCEHHLWNPRKLFVGRRSHIHVRQSTSNLQRNHIVLLE